MRRWLLVKLRSGYLAHCRRGESQRALCGAYVGNYIELVDDDYTNKCRKCHILAVSNGS